MIVEQRRNDYSGDGAGGASAMFNEEEDETETDIVLEPLEPSQLMESLGMLSVADDVKVKGLHRKLTAALIDHIWNSRRNSASECMPACGVVVSMCCKRFGTRGRLA